MKRGGKVLNRYIKTLTFQVEGSYFPLNPYNTSVQQIHPTCTFMFYSSVPNTVTINFGDGVVVVKEFIEETPGIYVFGWRGENSYYNSQPYDDEIHIFQDDTTQARNISFEFENILAIYENPLNFCGIIKTPPEWEYTSLTELNILNTLTIEDIERVPSTVTNRLRLQNAFSQKKTQIPDQWFSATNVRFLYFANSFDFSDSLASNLYKINQFPLAEIIDFNSCNLNNLPDSINDLHYLDQLKIESNDFTSIPKLSNPSVKRVDMFGNNQISNPVIPNWNGNLYLETLNWNFTPINSLDFSTIPQNWNGMKNLKTIRLNFSTDIQFNNYISNLYQLCTENAFIDPSSQEAIDSGWPNQFRVLNWGDSSLTVDNTVEPAPGFQAGISNGSPQHNGHKVYAMLVNYAHNIQFNN